MQPNIVRIGGAALISKLPAALDLSTVGDEALRTMAESLRTAAGSSHLRAVKLPAGRDDSFEVVLAETTALDLRQKTVGHGAATLLGVLTHLSTSLTEVNLDGFALPVERLKGTDAVDTIDMPRRELGVNSAIVVASLIGANGSLTSLDVSDNRIGNEGARAIGES